ncbi:hypothetical protein D027_2498B, partial [Vibrio parahaemolyticus 861]
DIGLIQSIAFH